MGPHPAVAQARSGVRRGLAGLEPGDLVLAACSGGGDSLALAAALAHEAPRLGQRGGGVTVDHGHQDGSAARAARYAALEQVAEHAGAVAVLLGHTLDDQAETVLLGLARGAGGRSLAGMPARRGRFRRPLLGTARATLRAACAAQQLEPWDDPHNADPAYTRARVRHQALPALEAALGPGVAVALARSAAQLTADCDALDAIAAAEAWRIEPAPADRAGADGSGHAVSVVDIEGLAELATAVRSRVLRQAALAAGCPAGSLAARHIAALDALVTSWHGQRWADLPGVIRAQRRYGKLLFSKGRPAGAGAPERTEAEAAGGRE